MKELKNNIITLSHRAVSVQTPHETLKLAESIQRMADAYCRIREIEIHEEFHRQHPNDFTLPGEEPLKGSN